MPDPSSSPAASLPLAAAIDAVVRPTGGPPRITARALNGLLRRLATELAPPAPVVPAPLALPAVRVRDAFGPGQPITFDAATDYEDAEGLPLTEGFDGEQSLGAFSYAGAVRGTTVRVCYYAAQPIGLPPGFTWLGGGAPLAPHRTHVLHLRYVRPGVVDVLAGPGEPDFYVGRFWAAPGRAAMGVGLYMGPDTRVLAVGSEGQHVRSGAFNGGGPGVHFAHAADGPGYFDVYAYAGRRANDRLNADLAGIGPVYGELNLDTLPPLAGNYALLQYSRGYTRVIAHQPGLQLELAFRYENTLLDLGSCVVRYLNLFSSYCTDIVLPPANEALTFLNLSEHRLYGKELRLERMPNLATLDLSTGQPYVGRLDVLDIAQLPGLVSLSTSQAALRTLAVGDTTFAHLEVLNFYMGRLTARDVPYGRGGLPALLALLGRAPRLRTLLLCFNGLSEAEQGQVVAALLAASPAASPAPPEGRVLALGDEPGGNTPFAYLLPGYPGPCNNDPNFGFSANAPVVSAATRAAIGRLQAAGWVVHYNEAVPLLATVGPGGTLHATYQGPAPIDVWAPGDQVQLASADGRYVPAGPYTVAGGEAHTWQLAPAAGTPAPAPEGAQVWVAATPPPPG